MVVIKFRTGIALLREHIAVYVSAPSFYCSLFQISVLTTSHALLIPYLGETL